MRANLLTFRLDTLPLYRKRTYSRVYQFIVRQHLRRKSRDLAERSNTGLVRKALFKSKILDLFSRANRRSLGFVKGGKVGRTTVRTSQSSMGDVSGSHDGSGSTTERGSRRKKLAGYLKAANDIRQSYQNAYASRGRNAEDVDMNGDGIPGAFPDLVVSRSGVEELVLFPSYARRHSKREQLKVPRNAPSAPLTEGRESSTANDPDYWRREWEVYEDKNAVVDVDVRGWVYSPHSGPMTRKNRLLFGIARQLSGIPAPQTTSAPSSRAASRHGETISEREVEQVEREAERITQRGRREADVAGRGGYSEIPDRRSDTRNNSANGPSRTPSPKSSPKPGDFPHPVTNSSLDLEDAPAPAPSGISKRASWNQPADMSAAELATANNHLVARLKPFLSNPSVNRSITIFYYNESTSQSRTTTTNDAGHFNFRAALNFVPTHARVLISSHLSATEEVRITEPTGISLISDIDDTIKHSAIGNGAREIFRNTFIRDLGDLTIEGVREWYSEMSDVGVNLHYVSNAPWQLYPVLVSFFSGAQLPPGSFHLKQYTGMLQGIFEPVAERKKGTLDRIMRDFPERRFILVGDSGEADLELYTDTVLANPGRILGVFIRDVTTISGVAFFDTSMGPLSSARGSRSPGPRRPVKTGSISPGKLAARLHEKLPNPPPRPLTELPQHRRESPHNPVIGDLISFDDEEIEPGGPLRSFTDPVALEADRKASVSSLKSLPPDRPSKPLALRGSPGSARSESSSNSHLITSTTRDIPPPLPKPGRLSTARSGSTTDSVPLTKSQTDSSSRTSHSRNSSTDQEREHRSYRSAVKSKVADAYNALPSPAAYWHSSTTTLTSSSTSTSTPSSSHQPQSASANNNTAPAAAPSSSASPAAPPVPPRRGISSYPAAAAQYASNKLWTGEGHNSNSNHNGHHSTGSGDEMPPSPLNKKAELWRRRWGRAKEVLDEKGVMLRTWRVGGDVRDDARALVERARGEEVEIEKGREREREREKGREKEKGEGGKRK